MIETLKQLADDSPELEDDGPPVSQVGYFWLLGAHRLLCADARVGASYETLTTGRSARTVFTDPPYSVQINGPRLRVRPGPACGIRDGLKRDVGEGLHGLLE
jgi:hypothetical protein